MNVLDKQLIEAVSEAVKSDQTSQTVESTKALSEASKLMDSPTNTPSVQGASLQPEAEIAKATQGESVFVQSSATRNLTLPAVVSGNAQSVASIKPLTKIKEAEVPEQLLESHNTVLEHAKQVAHNEANAKETSTGNIKFVAGNSVSLDSLHRTSITSDGGLHFQAPHKESHVTGSIDNYVHKTEWGHLNTAVIDSRVLKASNNIKYTVSDLTVASNIQGLVGRSGYRDTTDSLHDVTTNMRSDATSIDTRASKNISIRSNGALNHQAASSYLLAVGAPTPTGEAPGFFAALSMAGIAKDLLSSGISGLGNIKTQPGYIKSVTAEGRVSSYSQSRDIFTTSTKEVTSKVKTEIVGKEHHTVSKGLVTNLSKGISLEGISGGVLKLSNKKFSIIMRGMLGDIAAPLIEKVLGCIQFPDMPKLPEVDLPKAKGLDLTQILDLKCGSKSINPEGHIGVSDPLSTSGGNLGSQRASGKASFPTSAQPNVSRPGTYPSRSTPGSTIPASISGANLLGDALLEAGSGIPNAGNSTTSNQTGSGSSSGNPSSSSDALGIPPISSASISKTNERLMAATRNTVSSTNATASPVFQSPLGIYVDRYMGDTLPGDTDLFKSSTIEVDRSLKLSSPSYDLEAILLDALPEVAPRSIPNIISMYDLVREGEVPLEKGMEELERLGMPREVYDILTAGSPFEENPSVSAMGGLSISSILQPLGLPPSILGVGIASSLENILNEMLKEAPTNKVENLQRYTNILGLNLDPVFASMDSSGVIDSSKLVSQVLSGLSLPGGISLKPSKGEDGRYSITLSADDLLKSQLTDLTSKIGDIDAIKKTYGVLEHLGLGEDLQSQSAKLLEQLTECTSNWLNLKAAIGLPKLNLDSLTQLIPNLPNEDLKELMDSLNVKSIGELTGVLGDLTKGDLSSLPQLALKLLKGWGLCK